MDSTADALIPAGADGAKVAAIKNRCPDVFVNARVDTYWLGQDATVAAIPIPLNVLVIPDLSLAELAALGVRRISTGSLPYRAAIHAAVEVAAAVRDGGTLPAATPYAELQARLVRYSQTTT